MNRSERGFTLIEILVGLAIAGLIGTSVTTTLVQLLTQNSRNSARVIAVKQVENAAHWLTRDIQMAQEVTYNLDDDSRFPLTLSWTNWDDEAYSVEYRTINGNLEREQTIDGSGTTLIVAKNIDTSAVNTYCQFLSVGNDSEQAEDESVLLAGYQVFIRMTATVTFSGQTVSEVREMRVIPRPA